MILVWLFLFTICAESFEISKSHQGVFYVIEGKRAEISCQSSDSFSQCKWTRPNVLDTCGIFQNTADCKTEISDDGGASIKVAPWRISRQSNQCLLDLNQVGPNEAGIWTCNLESIPDENADYKTATASFEVKLLKQPSLTMDAPQNLEMIDARNSKLKCQVASTLQVQPSIIEWTIDGNKIGDGSSIDVTAQRSWNGKTMECSVNQEDSFGNSIKTTDARTVKIVSKRYEDDVHRGKTAKAGEFWMLDFYPQRESIVLAENTDVTFSCKTTTPWFDCKWKHPLHTEPCAMYHYNGATTCPWTSQNGGRWTIEKTSETECIIRGDKIDATDANLWDCHLGSFPIQNQSPDIYESAKHNFRVQLVTMALVDQNQLEEETVLTEGQVSEITVTIDNNNANPKPHFQWFLDGKAINQQQSSQNGGLSNTLRYEAKLNDDGLRLTCQISQVDDVNHEVPSGVVSTRLKIQAPEEFEGMSTTGITIISSVVGLIVLIILVVVLFLWVTNKGCFAASRGSAVRERPMGAMEVQTVNSQPQMSDFATGVDFGPQKPLRSAASKDELSKPLLGSDQEDSAGKLEVLLSVDELNSWNDEGPPMSNATSLSSLDTQVSDKDWYETFKSFGPKFAHLAQMFEGTEDSDNDDGGTEV